MRSVKPMSISMHSPDRMASLLRALAVCLLLVLFSVPAAAQEVRIHTVQQGDTLYRIAQEYGVSVDNLRTWNDLDSDHLAVGQELVVGHLEEAPPPEETPPEPVVIEEGEMVEAGRYRAGTGDTFFSIAAHLEVTADTLARLNPDRVTRPLQAGDTLRVPDAARTEVTHVVEPGENLSRIANRYGVTVAQIRAANNLQSDVLQVGQSLIIRAEVGTVEEAPDAVVAEGPVGIYPGAFAGRVTASGDRYEPELFTASHPEWSFGTVVLLTNPATGRQTFALINDRGPVDRNLIMEVSAAVADVLGIEEFDEQPVEVRFVR